MKKSDRISALVGERVGEFDPRYTGYFTCFNAQQYYEAHDVLEDLWLRTEGGDRDFYQGLIQLAGAFVHLQKNFLHPAHPKHATRRLPAARLFTLAATRLGPYRPVHLGLDVDEVVHLCRRMAADCAQHPWHPTRAPQLHVAGKFEARNSKLETNERRNI
jgi:predicted metal-dependent hydrolase